jgi:short-subunit dehydrogenase
VLPRFLSREAGQIVLISSMAAKIYSPGQATYAAAKAAASSFHHTLHVCDLLSNARVDFL